MEQRKSAYKFEFVREDEWPPLAWLAICEESKSIIVVRHGAQVETRDDWFCEAIWDGDFVNGDFDQTDLVFGSGGRIRDGKVVFVSSGATVDRLQSYQLDGRAWISNSLVCLIANCGASLNITYPRFPDFFRSIEQGIDGYEKQLPTLVGLLQITYFRNLEWNARRLSEKDKPHSRRDFSNFENYHRFLRESVKEIALNMRESGRNHAYEMVAGLSSGYDSTTATVLAREAGMKHVFSFRTARGGYPDHGKDVARILGLNLTMMDRLDWRRSKYAEVPYLAATGVGVDVNLSSAQDVLRGRVFVSGFHGDKAWAKDTKALGADLVRGDTTGLAFTEHRLSLGCIHFPVPFMGVRQINDIHALSVSSELTSWDVSGDYSRPICRRIVEEAGIPRDIFGVKKKATTNQFRQGETKLTELTRARYHSWLSKNKRLWTTSGIAAPRVPGRLFSNFQDRYYLISRLLRGVSKVIPSDAGDWIVRKDSQLQRWMVRRATLLSSLFPWAIEQASERYISAAKRDLPNESPDSSIRHRARSSLTQGS